MELFQVELVRLLDTNHPMVRLERNRLWGKQGHMANAILSAAGMNFRKLLKHAGVLLRAVLEYLRAAADEARPA